VINLAIFIVGLLSSQKINLFGEVFVGEALCGLVLLFNAKAIRVPPGGRLLLGLLFVWFVAQFASDIINQTEIIKALKGILVPVFVAIILLGLSTAFYRRYQYLPIYLLGVFVGLWVSRFLGSEYYASNPWKWGLGSCVALCFFTWIHFYCKVYRNVYLLVGAVAFVVVSLANSSRSMAAFMLLASVLALLSSRIQLLPFYRRLGASSSGRLQLVGIMLFGVFVADRAMVGLFSFGPFLDLLPLADAAKYSAQAANEWGAILGGRTELLVSLEAFGDSPLWGHGSWAENPYYVYSHLDKVDASGSLLMDLKAAESNISSYLIPSHSYLMGAVVWGGVFAGLFWLRVLGICVRGVLCNSILSSPLYMYITIGMLWDILFSPFGADARWMSTLLLWILLSVAEIESSKKEVVL
jgi:hypothetical protein